MATRRALYRATAEEGFDMVAHISNLRKLQEELHIMDNKVTDEDFVMILITSLPESWDNYTSSYLGSKGNKPELLSHELVAILMEEDRRRKSRNGDSAGASLQAKYSKGQKNNNKKTDPNTECYNCHKKGHMASDCWAKGGGKEGQGPKGRKGPNRGNKSNQAQETNSNLNDVSYMALSNPKYTKFDWYFDTATTSHICTQRDAFIDYYPLQNSTIDGIGPNPAIATGRGTVLVNFSVDGKIIPPRLSNVLYVPNAANCLLSGTRFDDSGGIFTGGNGKCILKDKNGRIVGRGNKVDRLYLLDARAQLLGQERTNYANTTQKRTWDQWHKNFGHIAVPSLERLYQEKMVDGMAVDESSIPSKSCEACIQAKQAHKSFPQEAEHRSLEPGERVMSDVWGPAGKESIGKWKYYISFTDDCTRYVHVLFLKDKGQAFDRIKERILQIKRQFGKVPKWIRFDNGKELVNDKLKKLAADEGITIETSAPYSPSQNGVAERFNRTLLELARAMIIGKNMPQFLWDEAVSHAAYLRNRAPTRALKGKTPYEAYHKLIPSVAHLREFGSNVWILDESENRSKLDPKSKKMVFVGFMDGSKSVRYYDAKKRNIKVSRNFTFNENEEPGELKEIAKVPSLQAEGENLDSTPLQTEPKFSSGTPQNAETLLDTQEKSDDSSKIRNLRRTAQIDYRKLNNPQAKLPSLRNLPSPSQSPLPTAPSDITRATESSKTKSKSQEKTNLALEKIIQEQIEYSFISTSTDDPKTVDEALTGSEAEEWRKAMEIEIETLKKMGTWRLEDLPEGRETVGCKWVFVKKRDEHGNIIRYKARLVAQGFSQKPGIDYSNDGTFAPVMRFESLRTLLALGAINNWKLRQFDIKGAYLHGTLHETIYMRQPEGFDDGSGHVCRLIRPIYGLKQSGNIWNEEFSSTMIEIGFTQLKTDYCCFIRRAENDDFTILIVWVDDILSFSLTDAGNDHIEQELKRKFEVNSIGNPNMILGIKFTQEDNYISLSQAHFVETLLQKFGLENANPVSTPIDPNINLDTPETSENEDKPNEKISNSYATLISSLMYLALGTRPDISYAVNKLAQFTQKPQPKHWTAVKRIFRYLKGTRNYSLTYGGSEDLLNQDMNIFCDADWASDADRKSVSGYVITIGGGAVAWSSKKQSTVALSTAEAEYIAATHAAKQILWHRSLFQELEIDLPRTSTIFSDNQAAIAIAHHPEFHARTKHIDIAHHFFRDLVKSGILNIVYVNTHNNLADIFTKGLPRVTHQNLTYEIGVLPDQGGVLE